MSLRPEMGAAPQAGVRAGIERALRQSGLAEGDLVLVHSDASRVMQLSGAEWWADALALLQECFLAVLGASGTLVVPTFNYEFCRGQPYDHERTPSQVGLFTNHVRRDRRAVRSFHPIFSFAAIGPQAETLCEAVSHSAFGAGSVFARLYQAGAKLVFFDTTLEFCTFIHFVEQRLNVDYRYLKYFTGVVRRGGQEYVDTFDFFVRYLNRGLRTRLAPLGERLEKSGLMRRVEFEGLSILQVPVRDFERVARQTWLENPYAFLAEPPSASPDDAPRYAEVERAPARDFSAARLVAELHPLHRTLVSEGTDQALALVGQYVPPEASYGLEIYPPLKRVWTWRVPERYVVEEAYLETEDGQRIVDFADNPLHLVSYSVSVDRVLSWAELEPHLFFSAQRPQAIPWVFKYYERNWGFCLTQQQFERLPHDRRYHARIRSQFVAEPAQGLRVGVAVVPPAEAAAGEMLICAHICHPAQANDDAAGVAVCVEVLRRLARQPLPPGSMSIRFLFGPETIGTICYLGHHPDRLGQFKGGIFVEMAGNRNTLALQRTRQDNHLLDRVARYVLQRRGLEFREAGFREVIRNDEMIINGPGVNVPCISLSRWPYAEYHTSDDNPSIIHADCLAETADVIEAVVRIFASNYRPIRTFRGPIFLSGYGLHVDQRVNRELNRALEQVMLRLEGERTVFDIATDVGMDYWEIREYVEQLRGRGLVQAAPIPGSSGESPPA